MKNSLKNLLTAFIGQFIGILAVFVTRKIFIEILNAEYLGIDALFTNIISLLSLVELGIGPSMAFALYKPIANGDKEKIKSLMYTYKKAYHLIAVAILVLGVAFLPFYRYVINGNTDIGVNLDIVYLMFVINCVASYILSYKRTLIISNEKKYVATIIRYSCYVAMNVLQILILILTKNYYLYLALQILFTIIDNVFVSAAANKMYGYLKEKDIHPLDKQEKKSLRKNISAMLFHKVGGLVVNSTDNILISKFVDVIYVGINSNYLLITNALTSITNQFFEATIASVGRIGAKENIKKLKEVFRKAFFFNFVLFGMLSCVLFNVVNDFLNMWVGDSYAFPLYIVAMIVAVFYLRGIRKSCLMFRDALGLFWFDRYKPLAEAAINLILSIVLAQYIGIAGIFIGTIVSSILAPIWVEPYILYKRGFKESPLRYYSKLIEYTLFTVATTALVYIINCSITFIPNLVLGFILKSVISIAIFTILVVIIYGRTEEFRYYINLVRKILGKVRRKK